MPQSLKAVLMYTKLSPFMFTTHNNSLQHHPASVLYYIILHTKKEFYFEKTLNLLLDVLAKRKITQNHKTLAKRQLARYPVRSVLLAKFDL
jgi:hypothetical protein